MSEMMKLRWLSLAFAVCGFPSALSLHAAEPRQDLRLDVTRDAWFSNVGQEADGGNGGAGRLKVKSIQEMSLLDFDAKLLRGRLVHSAALHIRPSGAEILHRVTISGISADWTEGTASGYQAEPGSSCFNWRHSPGVPWAYPGSNFCEVILGRGGSRWRTADASPPGEGGWQSVPVDPRVIATRVAGCSFGLLLFDDTGSEWRHSGDQFTLYLFPNRFLYSRDGGRQNAPYLTVELGERDEQPPQAIGGLAVETEGLPPGEPRVSWLTPKDEGPGETIGFHATLNGEALPCYLLPAAGAAGERVTMHLRDVTFGDKAELAVWAVDSAGNEGPPTHARLPKPATVASVLPPRLDSSLAPPDALPKLAGAEVAVIDPLDKVAPAAKMLIPQPPPGYPRANHLWNATEREIHIYAAKNEFTGFQLWLNGKMPALTLNTTFSGTHDPAQVEWFRLFPVPVGNVAICDAALPLESVVENGSTRAFVTQRAPDLQSATLAQGQLLSDAGGALLCEMYVPHDTPAGEYTGELTLGAWLDKLHIKLRLTVWDFTLPDDLSFLPEMNCYGLPDNERDYYRLAHRHRTFLNRVPYHQNGAMAEGCAPEWDGKQLDWSAWDQRFGPYLDGSAFADLPRSGVPIEGFYLPWHENWPSPMEGNYNDNYWADRAFPAAYRQALVEVARQMAKHFDERGWHRTLFQGFLNNKNNFKERGWSRGSSPWLLDEPANFQDYWALAWFGQAFHEGVDAARGRAKVLFRCDISRPEWQRDLFDDVLDYNVVGGAMRRYRRMVLDRKQAHGQVVVEYGSANAIDQSNVQPAAWCVDAWALGVDGVLPWQTIGTETSWKKADTLALFYPGEAAGQPNPIPSLRLKAFCRGQQDVEYLTLFSHLKQAPRWQVGAEARKWLGLSGERRGSGLAAAEDAGVIHYDRIKPRDLWELRMAIGKVLSAAHPAAKRRLVEFNVPTRPRRPLSERLLE